MQRHKWTTTPFVQQVNDLVLILEDNILRTQCLMISQHLNDVITNVIMRLVAKLVPAIVSDGCVTPPCGGKRM
ncbi:hypothetical protein T08_7393 [Trichinella sp. T8]|nr:hypothetical protein T08_7393 [Trichinella sp. T8]